MIEYIAVTWHDFLKMSFQIIELRRKSFQTHEVYLSGIRQCLLVEKIGIFNTILQVFTAIFLTIKSQEISHKDNMHRTIFKTINHSLVCVLAKYLAVPTKWFLQSHCANLSPYRSYLVSIDKERNNFARASKKVPLQKYGF